MANAKTIINLDKLQAVYAGNIESIKYASAALENGRVGVLGNLVSGETEAYEFVTPTDVTTEEVLLHASPEVLYEAGKQIGDFELAAGKIGRAYHLTVGDVFTITDDAFIGSSVVGQYLIPQNGSFQLTAAADLTGNTRLALQVIEKGTLGYDGNAATTVRVVKA